ncbi:MAG: Nif3-like dinuclear metal center hexameric protein [Planctomycetaceae bacterium]
MLTLAELLQYLDTQYPPDLAESWDNVGLLVGREESQIGSILTCLTLTPDVAAEAVREKVDLIIAHHPILFRPVQKITSATVEGEMLLGLIESRIAVFSPHTRYDSAPAGINQQLAEQLGLTSIRSIRPIETESVPAGVNQTGAGRWGQLPVPQSLEKFALKVKECLQAPAISLSGAPLDQVSKVAIACGSAGEFLQDAALLGCDLFITGEARFHTAFEAEQLGVALLLAGHYQTERPAMEAMAVRLQEQFPQLSIKASQDESDPFRWI